MAANESVIYGHDKSLTKHYSEVRLIYASKKHFQFKSFKQTLMDVTGYGERKLSRGL